MNATPIRQCPFCGGVEIDLETLPRPANGRPTTALVSCRGCGATGPVESEQNLEQALAAWISRPGDDTLDSCCATDPVFFLNL